MRAIGSSLILAILFGLPACGGAKLLKQVAPMPERQTALAVATDPNLALELRLVIVRNGPAAWAKNADWDEYLIDIRNIGNAPVRIDGAELMDSQGQVTSVMRDRASLVAASKQTSKRYGDAGFKVEAGRGGAALVATGIVAGVLAYGTATVAVTGAALGGGAAGGSAAAAAGGLMIAAPLLVGIGMTRAVHNGQLSHRIRDRASRLPVDLAPGASLSLDLFFPLSPSPRQLSLRYQDGQVEHRLDLDTNAALSGLHLAPASAPH